MNKYLSRLLKEGESLMVRALVNSMVEVTLSTAPVISALCLGVAIFFGANEDKAIMVLALSVLAHAAASIARHILKDWIAGRE